MKNDEIGFDIKLPLEQRHLIKMIFNLQSIKNDNVSRLIESLNVSKQELTELLCNWAIVSSYKGKDENVSLKMKPRMILLSYILINCLQRGATSADDYCNDAFVCVLRNRLFSSLYS